MTTKSELRKKFSFIRNNISDEKLFTAEQDLMSIVRKNVNLFKEKKISCYWSTGKEMPTLSLIEYLSEIGSEIYLPTIKNNSRVLIFNRFEDKSKLVKNKYGIYEQPTGKKLDIEDLEIILIPCVCFDSNGFRIGMGKGYYDHSLAESQSNKQILIIVAYEFQRIENCFPEAHDIKAKALLSDQNLQNF
tara:strand:+ start:66 stop:632 length:567 start_codon:yes stop_codon:yes gene_type:complete